MGDAGQVRKATALEASGAVRLDACFTLDPHRACLGLAAAAKSRGATFFERSRSLAFVPAPGK